MKLYTNTVSILHIINEQHEHKEITATTHLKQILYQAQVKNS